jgi:hypothetical protein
MFSKLLTAKRSTTIQEMTVTFPRQQWLSERVTKSRYTQVTYLVVHSEQVLRQLDRLVPWLRPWDADVSTWGLGINSRPFHMGLVEYKVAMKQVSLVVNLGIVIPFYLSIDIFILLSSDTTLWTLRTNLNLSILFRLCCCDSISLEPRQTAETCCSKYNSVQCSKCCIRSDNRSRYRFSRNISFASCPYHSTNTPYPFTHSSPAIYNFDNWQRR